MFDVSPELAESGYAWEIADAPILHNALNIADIAHALDLLDAGAISRADTQTLLGGLLHLESLPSSEVNYDPSIGEMVTCREQFLVDLVGPVAGSLRAGRTRREAVRTALRLVVRQQVLALTQDSCALIEAICARSIEHSHSLMPDYTYLQPAQASTFGHYLLSFADPVLRDANRLLSEHVHVNSSVSGSGGANGSVIIRDRMRAAHNLGFNKPIEHVRDAMWQTDPFLHVLFSASSVRPSVLMPQKRNPYALSVIRGSTGILIGRLTGQLALSKAPSARSDTYIYAYGELPRSLALAGQVTRLLTSVVRDLVVHEARMKSAIEGSNTEAADAAHLLMRSCGLDYLTAHRVIRAAITHAAEDDRGISADDITWALIDGGFDPEQVEADELDEIFDPMALIQSRKSIGGAAPDTVTAMAGSLLAAALDLRTRLGAEQNNSESAESHLLIRARELVQE
jgi:argininosuccinate lyase